MVLPILKNSNGAADSNLIVLITSLNSSQYFTYHGGIIQAITGTSKRYVFVANYIASSGR